MPGGRDEIVQLSLEDFANRCAESGHVKCHGTESCLDALDSHRATVVAEGLARAFDVRTIAQNYTRLQPAATWPTAALMHTVSTELLVPPWRASPSARSIRLSSALARLGERGIPPDGIIRTCLGRELRRAIFIRTAWSWCGVATGELEFDGLPRALRDWLQLAQDIETSLPGAPFAVLTLLEGSAARVTFDNWLKTAPLSSVLAWSRDREIEDISNDEMVLHAGADATRWVVDRFNHTLLDDWQRSSLEWELAFQHQPTLIADRVGLTAELLSERLVTAEMVHAAMVRHLCTPRSTTPVIEDLTVPEIISQLVALGRSGDIDQARSLIKQASQLAPDDAHLANALAFFTIPSDPDRAIAEFQRLPFGDNLPPTLRFINLASANLAAGSLDEAHELGERVAHLAASDPAILWLWLPTALTPGSNGKRIESYRASDWLKEFRSVIAQQRAAEAPSSEP